MSRQTRQNDIPDAYKMLARDVLRSAVEDASGETEERKEVALFLDSARCELWCNAAGVNTKMYVERVRKLLRRD